MSDAVADSQLFHLIQRGDEKAFKTLFDLYYVPLCRFVHLYLENRQEAEEVVMDIFIYLWEHRQTLRIETSLSAYLFQASRNRTCNALRNKAKTLSFDQLTTEPCTTMEQALEIEDLYRLVKKAVVNLPERCREVFLRSRLNNESNRKIADDLNISVKTVEAQMTKALKQIKQVLDSDSL